MSGTITELLDSEALMLLGYEIRVQTLLCSGEPRTPILVNVDFYDMDGEDPDEAVPVGHIEVSLLEAFDFDTCDDISQDMYELWQEASDANLLSHDRFGGNVLTIDDIAFHPGHNGEGVRESLVNVIVDHLTNFSFTVVTSTRIVGNNVDLSVVGFNSEAKSLLVFDALGS
jgi:hypothetical protein